MNKIILLLFMFSYCSNPDDVFFFLNPNKKQVLKEERDKCRRDGALFYLLNASVSDELKYKECDDPNSTQRKRNPDPVECRRKARADFDIFIFAGILSCPKGLLDD